LPHPELRQGAADAKPQAGQRWADHAKPRHHHGRPGVIARLAVIGFLAAVLAGAAPAPAGNPEVPEKYISVDQAKALLDKHEPVTFTDVRGKSQYDDLHIKGPMNIPLGVLPARPSAVPATRQDIL